MPLIPLLLPFSWCEKGFSAPISDPPEKACVLYPSCIFQYRSLCFIAGRENGDSLDPGPNTQDVLSLHRTPLAMGLSLMISPALGGRSREEPDIDIVILTQFLERGHDLATDELLAFGRALRRRRWGSGFQLAEGRGLVR